MSEVLPPEFVKLVKDDIEKKVLPHLETSFLNHYPHLKISYRIKDPGTFLFAYVISNLEANYDTRFVQDYGLAKHNRDVYFAIHRTIAEYQEQIMAEVKEYLSKLK